MYINGDAKSINNFANRFNVDADKIKSYNPLLISITYSSGGEQALSYGLFVKNGVMYEVHGTECSVWDFNGQWEPEPVSLDELKYKLKNKIGIDDNGYDIFQSDLIKLVGDIENAPDKYKINLNMCNHLNILNVSFLKSHDVGYLKDLLEEQYQEVKNFNNDDYNNVLSFYNDNIILQNELTNNSVYCFDFKGDYGSYYAYIFGNDEYTAQKVCISYNDKNASNLRIETSEINKFISDFYGGFLLKENVFVSKKDTVTISKPKKNNF